MKISCVQPCLYPENKSLSFKNTISERRLERRQQLKDIGISIGVGVAAGLITAGVLYKKKAPYAFINSLEIGAVFSYITYIVTLLTAPFRLK